MQGFHPLGFSGMAANVEQSLIHRIVFRFFGWICGTWISMKAFACRLKISQQDLWVAGELRDEFCFFLVRV